MQKCLVYVTVPLYILSLLITKLSEASLCFHIYWIDFKDKQVNAQSKEIYSKKLERKTFSLINQYF